MKLTSGILLLLFAFLTFATLACDTDDDDGEQITFRVIAAGEASGVTQQLQTVIRDQGAWNDLWRTHVTAYEPPDAPAPVIDFNADSVAIIFLGTKTTRGYEVRLRNVTREGNRIVVRYSVHFDSVRATRAPGNPFVFFTIPRSALAIVFERVS